MELTLLQEKRDTADRLSLARIAQHSKPEAVNKILKDLKKPWL